MSSKKDKIRCQCLPTCNNPPLDNSPFCKEHLQFCPRKSPLTGYEPEYNPNIYNNTRKIRESHNCFAYAFNHMDIPSDNKCNDDSCSIPFHQPGRASGYPKWSKVKGKRCPDILSRLKGDVKGLQMINFTEKCPKNTSKIALVADEDQDYHFYRQDSNGMWSHKPGATRVTKLDADGRPIYDPSLASRKYKSGLDYDRFCSFLCAPKNRKLHFKRGGKRSESKRQATCGKRQATCGKRQATCGKRQATCGKPKATCGKPKATCGKPKATYSKTRKLKRNN